MRATTRLGVLLATLGLAAAPFSDALEFHDHREHAHKADVVRSVEAPSERLTDVPCQGGSADVFACDGVDLLSFVPLDEMFSENTDVLTGGGLSDVWGWTDVGTGDEYVLFGKTNGTAVYRITDPTDPVYLGEVPNPSPAQLIWHDIKIDDDYAFIVSETPGHGVQVLDLRRLRGMDAAPTVPFSITPDSHYAVDGTAHNIVVNEETDTAYLVGSGTVLGFAGACTTESVSTDNAGLHAIDIRNPLAPRYLGCYADDGYVHDAQCVVYRGPDVEHQGKEICITAHEDGASIVDVTDKADMVRLSDTDEEDYPDVGYSHQGWLSEDQATYFHGDELDEDGERPTRTFVFDVSDLDDIELAFVNEPGGVNIDHNMYTRGDLLYQSNYTAGLQIFDTRNVDAGRLPMVAFFDTYPDDDDATFDGTWSNYPYFGSGTVAVTGIGEGLFLLRPHDDILRLQDDRDTKGAKPVKAGGR